MGLSEDDQGTPWVNKKTKATQETHMEEVSELRGIFLLSLKGAEADQKAANVSFA